MPPVVAEALRSKGRPTPETGLCGNDTSSIFNASRAVSETDGTSTKSEDSHADGDYASKGWNFPATAPTKLVVEKSFPSAAYVS